jgi:competence protein CoiA
MPLRCLIEEKTVHSFDFSETEWNALKARYKSSTLTMPCCAGSAIPKTSRLGTPFFAHYRLGDCIHGAETKAYLLAKSIIAVAGQKAGWNITTEYPHSTPDGKTFITDVLAAKNKARISINLVWSTTPAFEEIKRKQKILRDAGIRGIWFVRLRKNRRYDDENFINEWETPVFGIRMMEDSSSFTVSKFGVKLDHFIAGMLSGKLAWVPQKKIQQDRGKIVPV